MTIFITDGDQRPALAIVRSLGRRGHRVLVGADSDTSLASASRYCAGSVTYPSPYHDRSGFERFLETFLRRERVDVLMPVTDVTMHSVCALQDRLRTHCALAVPPFDAFELVTDKEQLLRHAARCGVPAPRTTFVRGPADLARLDITFPAVVKPVRSRVRSGRGWLAGGVHYVQSAAELARLYDDHEYLASHHSLIQERIVGPGVGLFMLFDRGRVVAEFAHRRLREKPPAGGASVLCESTAIDPTLRAHAIALLAPLGWHGVAMIEFKQDRRTGRFVLMEVNGRFWGSLQLAVDAGVDFPSIACGLATGEAVTPPPAHRVGVQYRWTLGDLDHLLLRLLRSDEALDLPEAAPSRWQTLASFFRLVGPGLRYDVRLSDPRPFFAELRQYVGALGGAARRRSSRGAGAPRVLRTQDAR